ncbi:MAG: hypothetical protein E4H10_10845, partial [Bacteroidia bacterium]
MKRPSAPEIDVGIVKAASIRIRMEGEFKTGGEAASWQGNAELAVKNNSLVIRAGGAETRPGESVIFVPVEKECCRFAIEDV